MCNSLKWHLPWGDAKFCAVMCVEPPPVRSVFRVRSFDALRMLARLEFPFFWAAPAIPRWHVAVARREKVQVFTLEARTGKPKQDTKDAPSQRTKPEQGTKKAPSQGSPQPENRKPEQGTKKAPQSGKPPAREPSQNRARKKPPVRKETAESLFGV